MKEEEVESFSRDDKSWLNSIMLALTIYYTIAIFWMVVHIYFRRGNTANKLTLWPYILICTSGVVQTINYASALSFPRAQQKLAFVIIFCSF